MGTFIHASMHASNPAYARPKDKHTCIHTCMQACINTCMQACIHTCKYACVHTYIHACMHTYKHTSMHAYMPACKHASMHACTHEHKHSIHKRTSIHVSAFFQIKHICLRRDIHENMPIHTNQTASQPAREAGRQTYRPADRQRDRPRDRQTDGPTDRIHIYQLFACLKLDKLICKHTSVQT